MAVDLLRNFGHVLANCTVMNTNSGEEVNEFHQDSDIILSQFPVEPDLLKGIGDPLEWSAIIIIVVHPNPLGVIRLTKLSINQHKFLQFVQIKPDDPVDVGSSSLLELNFVAVELNIHWITSSHENLGDE